MLFVVCLECPFPLSSLVNPAALHISSWHIRYPDRLAQLFCYTLGETVCFLYQFVVHLWWESLMNSICPPLCGLSTKAGTVSVLVSLGVLSCTVQWQVRYPCNTGDMGFDSWVGKMTWRRQ